MCHLWWETELRAQLLHVPMCFHGYTHTKLFWPNIGIAISGSCGVGNCLLLNSLVWLGDFSSSKVLMSDGQLKCHKLMNFSSEDVILASLRRSLTSSWPHSINNSCCNSWHTERGPVAHWLPSHHIKHPHHIGESANMPTIPGSAMVALFSSPSPKLLV